MTITKQHIPEGFHPGISSQTGGRGLFRAPGLPMKRAELGPSEPKWARERATVSRRLTAHNVRERVADWLTNRDKVREKFLQTLHITRLRKFCRALSKCDTFCHENVVHLLQSEKRKKMRSRVTQHFIKTGCNSNLLSQYYRIEFVFSFVCIKRRL